MANYLLAYTGGSVPETEEKRGAQMAAWGKWFQDLGAAVVDGGNPVGPSRLISDGGAVSDGAPSGLTGYSVIVADSLDAATELARGCPVFTVGGSVEVYETFEVM
jgi:YCII-related domain